MIQKQNKLLDEMMSICKRLADLQLDATHTFVMDEYMKQEPLSKWLM